LLELTLIIKIYFEFKGKSTLQGRKKSIFFHKFIVQLLEMF